MGSTEISCSKGIFALGYFLEQEARKYFYRVAFVSSRVYLTSSRVALRGSALGDWDVFRT